MSLLAAGLALLILAPIALVDLVFLVEVLLGLASGRRSSPGGALPATDVLIPAHNEAASLGPHLEALRRVTPPGVRLLLVADNCSDETASVARASGVEVIERHDPMRRGKGYALAFGQTHLERTGAPEVVIVLDADCLPDPDAIARLSGLTAATGRPIQGAYLFRPAPLASAAVQVSNFAFAVKNLVRQRGGRRIGAAAILTGSGMAFPWSLFSRLHLATGEVVEDLVMGIALIRQGTPPLFDEHALIRSDASSEVGTDTQRARWEGGFLAVARRHALPLIGEGVARGSWKRFWQGLHLMVPPLALLLLVNVAASVVLAALVALGAPVGFLVAQAVLLLLLGAATLLAWWVVGRDQLPAIRLVALPLYLLRKLTLHRRIASGRQQVAWTRTERTEKDG